MLISTLSSQSLSLVLIVKLLTKPALLCHFFFLEGFKVRILQFLSNVFIQIIFSLVLSRVSSQNVWIKLAQKKSDKLLKAVQTLKWMRGMESNVL